VLYSTHKLLYWYGSPQLWCISTCCGCHNYNPAVYYSHQISVFLWRFRDHLSYTILIMLLGRFHWSYLEIYHCCRQQLCPSLIQIVANPVVDKTLSARCTVSDDEGRGSGCSAAPPNIAGCSAKAIYGSVSVVALDFRSLLDRPCYFC